MAFRLGFHAGHQVVRAALGGHLGFGLVDVLLDLSGLTLGDDEVLVAPEFRDFGFHLDDFLFQLGDGRLLALPARFERGGAAFVFAGALERFHREVFAAGAHGGFGFLFPLEFFGLLLFELGLGLALGGDDLLHGLLHLADLLFFVRDRLLEHEFGFFELFHHLRGGGLTDFKNA